MELLIKNARVIDFVSDFIGDIYVKDGIISEIGKELNKNCEHYRCKGKSTYALFY